MVCAYRGCSQTLLVFVETIDKDVEEGKDPSKRSVRGYVPNVWSSKAQVCRYRVGRG
jgi:hypothetical protein